VKAPSSVGYRSKEFGASTVEGLVLSRVVVQHPTTGHSLPAVCLSKPGAEKEPVLVTAQTGRAEGLRLAKPYLESGHPVMVADVSGVGEIGREKHIFYGRKERPDEGLGAMCYLMGEPLVGRRATDMLVLADVLSKRCNGRKPLLVAAGPLAIPAAHAVAADATAFSGVKFENRPASWSEVLQAGAADKTILYYADIVPTAALHYDWTELAD